MLTPDICIPAMHAMKDKFGGRATDVGSTRSPMPSIRRRPGEFTGTLGLDVGMTLLERGETEERERVEVVHGESRAAEGDATRRDR